MSSIRDSSGMVGQMIRYLSARLDVTDRGATAVEYGLIVALIAAVIIATVGVLGGQINDAFQSVVTGLT